MELRITVNLQLESATDFVKSFWRAVAGSSIAFGRPIGSEIPNLKFVAACRL
jgi:hypothetical protein